MTRRQRNLIKLISGVIVGEAAILSTLVGVPLWLVLAGIAAGSALVCWWVVSGYHLDNPPAVYAHQIDPYPSKIQSMIADTEVPLVELVLAVENWVEGRPDPDRNRKLWTVPPDARCRGCGIVPLSAFRAGSGQLLCRDCWDEYCELKTQLP